MNVETELRRISPGLAVIPLIVAKRQMFFDAEIDEGIEKAVLETGFKFDRLTGFSHSPDGDYPTLKQTLDELHNRLFNRIDAHIDWDAVRAKPQGPEQEVIDQACRLAKACFESFDKNDLDIDRIPF